MNFGEALELVKKGQGMRLPSWQEDVIIKAQYPDGMSKMTAPYLYVESRFGRVPWKETMIELFSEDWKVVAEDIKLEVGDVLVDALGEQHIVTEEGLANNEKEIPDAN